MKKILFIFLLILCSCTDNQRARNFGGTEVVYLENNEEFINITWRQNSLWIIVKDAISGDFYARESSPFYNKEGKVSIKNYEKRKD